MKFEFKKATIEDSNDLGYVHSISWGNAYKDIVSDEIINDYTPEKRAEVFKETFPTRKEELYLFKADGEPAGLAMLYKSHEENATDEEGEVYAIYFLPKYWGTEITHSAFDFCVDRLGQLGFKKVNIWLLEKNTRAQRFYEKHGFVFDGSKTVVEIGKPLTKIRYSRKI